MKFKCNGADKKGCLLDTCPHYKYHIKRAQCHQSYCVYIKQNVLCEMDSTAYKIRESLQPTDYEYTELGILQTKIDKTINIISALFSVLQEKEMLTDENISDIISTLED